MKFRGRATAVTAVLVLASFDALGAGVASNQTIDWMMMDENYNTKLYIRMTGTVATPATCSNHSTWHFVIDVGTPFGISMYAILLNAYTKPFAVTLLGKNNCDTHTGIETLRRIEMR